MLPPPCFESYRPLSCGLAEFSQNAAPLQMKLPRPSQPGAAGSSRVTVRAARRGVGRFCCDIQLCRGGGMRNSDQIRESTASCTKLLIDWPRSREVAACSTKQGEEGDMVLQAAWHELWASVAAPGMSLWSSATSHTWAAHARPRRS